MSQTAQLEFLAPDPIPIEGFAYQTDLVPLIWNARWWRALANYLVTGAFWLPVVWMQMLMRVLAEKGAAEGQPLPPAYHELFWA